MAQSIDEWLHPRPPLKVNSNIALDSIQNYFYVGNLFLGSTKISRKFIFDTGSSVTQIYLLL